MMLQLMMGHFERRTETLDLLGGSSTAAFTTLELEPEKPLPCGWEKCLDLKTGMVYYMNPSSGTKILNDPRGSLQSFLMKQPKVESTQCSSGEGLLHNDRTTREISVGSMSVRSRQECVQTDQKAFTQLGRPICEELLPKAATTSVLGQHEKSIDMYARDVRSNTAQESIANIGGLELDLNLATSTSTPEEKPLAAESSQNSLERRMADKSTMPTSSFRQSEVISRPRRNSTTSREYASTSEPQSEHEAESKRTEREEVTMAILGCPSCLMYVMLCKMDPKCPKCGSSVLMDFPSNHNNSTKRARIT